MTKSNAVATMILLTLLLTLFASAQRIDPIKKLAEQYTGFTKGNMALLKGSELKQIQTILSEYQKERDPYKLGFDCGLNGANTDNCHFAIFCTRENTEAWESGNRDGEAKRKEAHDETS